MIGNRFGVDLGADTVKIYTERLDRITEQKSMIAVRPSTGRVLAAGDAAYEMYAKTPPDIDVRTPSDKGTIADVDRAGFLMKKLLAAADERPGGKRVLYAAAPIDLSQIQKRAFSDMGELCGVQGGVILVDQPVCDARGCGIDTDATRGTILLNIGASCSILSVIVQGQTVISEMLEEGGRHMDEAIADSVRRHTNCLIGPRTAHRLKHALANTGTVRDARKTFGMDAITGTPREVIVSAEIVHEAVMPHLSHLAEAVSELWERMPPQIAENMEKQGLILSGGGARIPNTAEWFAEKTGHGAITARDYEMTTILGLREYMRAEETGAPK